MTVKPPLLVTVVLALAGCGDVAHLAAPGTSVGPATENGSCPSSYPAEDGPWAPEVPSAETEDRLVPDADPVLAHVCR